MVSWKAESDMGKLLRTVGGAALALMASACVIEASAGLGPGQVVSGPPPAPVAEGRPPPPAGSAIWVAGYWHWTGMQYTWIPGHWEQGHPGEMWRAPKYSLREGQYFYEDGVWVRPER
jgi:hypothetical protein